jgi:hypothetical protein
MPQSFLVANHESAVMKNKFSLEAQGTLDAVETFRKGPSQQPFVIKKYLPDQGLLQMKLWNSSAKISHSGVITCEVCLTIPNIKHGDPRALRPKLHELVDAPFNDVDVKLLAGQLDLEARKVGPQVNELVGEICATLDPMLMTVKIDTPQH